MAMYLKHHGVKGQRWGVRNGPPYPIENSKNRAIARVRYAAKTKSKVDDIVNSLSNDEKDKLGIDKGGQYLTIDEGEHVIHRVLKQIGSIPVSFFDMLDDGDTIQLALATRSGSSYRGKGYSSKAAEQAMKWLIKHPDIRNGRDIVWGVREDNSASIAIAKKMGFIEDKHSHRNGWVNYVNKVNHI